MDKPFEDSTEPFMPGDDLPKPERGDTMVLKDNPLLGYPKRLIVTDTHDDLAESWDPTGEDAWAMHDANAYSGHRGHWYAYGIALTDTHVDPNDPHDPYEDIYLVASYEVEKIEKKPCQ